MKQVTIADGVLSEDVYVTGTGQIVHNVHPATACEGRPCVIHRPSDHSMRQFPTHFRQYDGFVDIKPSHMERICPHGIGHPDPDDLAFHVANGDSHVGFHGCDGCCREEV